MTHKTPPRMPVVLCILDGWGDGPESASNGISTAKTPYWDWARGGACPVSILQASGPAVGLPMGQMGNSEVGHLTLGSGRIIEQDLVRINGAVDKNTFSQHPIWTSFPKTGVCHIIGLLSPGGVHSHEKHLWMMIDTVLCWGGTVAFHGILDGRDTAPKSAAPSIEETINRFGHNPKFCLASLSGRYYAMDRDHRWDRTQAFYDAVSGGKPGGANCFDNPLTYLDAYYDGGGTDEFMPPAVNVHYQGIRGGDSLLAGNFRSDRMRQTMGAFVFPDFTGFVRKKYIPFERVMTLTSYSDELGTACDVMFPPQSVPHHLGAVLSAHGLTQLRLAETEKYAHVTFFFNGGDETPLPGEDRFLIPSPAVKTYDLAPAMSAHALTDYAVSDILSGGHDVIIMNYANGDMVGHTGCLGPAVEAVQVLDKCIERLAGAVLSVDGVLVMTADHGNVEEMYDAATNMPHTAHTLNPVPFVVIRRDGGALSLAQAGTLADVAPTILDLLNIPIPPNMTGRSLIVP